MYNFFMLAVAAAATYISFQLMSWGHLVPASDIFLLAFIFLLLLSGMRFIILSDGKQVRDYVGRSLLSTFGLTILALVMLIIGHCSNNPEIVNGLRQGPALLLLGLVLLSLVMDIKKFFSWRKEKNVIDMP